MGGINRDQLSESETPDWSEPPQLLLGRGRKRDAVYELLKRQIMLREAEPGDALSELGLARQFGCSQGVVREALLRLQEDGLVLRSGYRGTSVSTIDPEEAEEMFLLRRSIEARGVRRAVRKLEESDLAEFSALVRRMEDAARAEDAYLLSEFDRALHMGVLRRARMPALEPFLSRCLLHNHRFKMTMSRPARPLLETASRHWRIVEALVQRDIDLAVGVIQQHVDTVADQDSGEVS